MEDIEFKIKKLERHYSWINWLACGLVVLALASLGLGLGLHVIQLLIGSSLIIFVALAILKIYDAVVRKKSDIMRGYYIEDGVKYFVDSKGKVIRKVEGKVVFDEEKNSNESN